MLDFSQTLAKLSQFLKAVPRRARKTTRTRDLNCCSKDFYDRSQRAALRLKAKSADAKASSTAAIAPALLAADKLVLALLERAIQLGGTLKISPENPNPIVTVLLPWEANDASTSATGS
jgi:hypothetical protein